MAEFGYALSSEEHSPLELVEYARRAEEVGFRFALISDHYHPWVARQGHSPFVWSVIGAIATATSSLRLGTGVTCPLIRVHPAVIAQAAATAAAMMPGRFFLGVGTGENLNEHVVGEGWPSSDVRREMLEDAVAAIRILWKGGEQSYRGIYYTVQDARLYTLPEEPPEIMVAASTEKSAELAANIGDGLVATKPDEELLRAFDDAGGARKPRYGQLAVCWAATDAEARKTAHEWWPNTGLPGDLTAELALPRHFEKACELVDEDTVAKEIVCSSDPEPHVKGLREFVDAGFDHVYVHQIGPDQEGFFRFYEKRVLPEVA